MNGEACVKCAGGIWWPWPHEIYRHSPTDGRNNYDATHYKASFPFSCCLSSFWVDSRHFTTADGCSKYATFFDYYLFEIVKRKWKLGIRKRNQDSRCGRLATAQRIKYDYEGAVRSSHKAVLHNTNLTSVRFCGLFRCVCVVRMCASSYNVTIRWFGISIISNPSTLHCCCCCCWKIRYVRPGRRSKSTITRVTLHANRAVMDRLWPSVRPFVVRHTFHCFVFVIFSSCTFESLLLLLLGCSMHQSGLQTGSRMRQVGLYSTVHRARAVVAAAVAARHDECARPHHRDAMMTMFLLLLLLFKPSAASVYFLTPFWIAQRMNEW